MNMKKLMMFVALLGGIQYSVLYTMEKSEEPEKPVQKEKETEEGGRGVKREREPERTPVQVCPWQPPKKRIKTVKPLGSLASAKLLPYALQQENFPEILESISAAKETLKLEAEGYFPTETMLHNARGALEVRNLIELGLDPNKLNNKGQTAINALIDRGNLEGAYYLLERFGETLKLKTRDELGFDPLQNAIRQKDSYLAHDIIQILIKQNKVKAVKQRKNKLGDTVLDLVLKEGLFELIPSLICIKDGIQQLYERVMKNAYGALEIPNLQIALFLITTLKVNARNAVRIQNLLQRGADINALYYFPHSSGNELLTLLMFFTRSIRKIEQLKILLDNKASVDFKTSKGRTALMFAIQNRNKEAVELLLEAGADVNVQDKKGITPLMLAVWNFPDSIPLLLKRGARLEDANVDGITVLMHAIFKKDMKAVELLLDAGADVNAHDKKGLTPLMGAAAYFPDIIPLLLEYGARLEDKDINDNTLLIFAIQYKNREAVELLLKARADVNAHDNKGFTPVMFAAAYFPDIIPLLLEYGACLEDKDINDNTLLMLAIQYKNGEAVELLLKAGANVNARNKAGESVLEVAQSRSTPEIIALIEARLKEIPQAMQEEEEGD